jgi:hypothetical protein
MNLLLILGVIGGCIFNLRFLWAMHRELQQSKSNPVVVIPLEVERGEQIEIGPLELRRGVLVAPSDFGREAEFNREENPCATWCSLGPQ